MRAISVAGCTLALVVCTCGAANAQAKTDVVILANGDRITGEIESLNSGLLTVTTDDMGTIRIEWDKVHSLTSSRRFEIETATGTLWYGALAAGGSHSIVVVAGTPTELDRVSIFRISTIEQGFWKRLDGSFNMGGSVTKSSGVGQIYASVQVGARSPSHDWLISYDSTTTFRENEDASGRYTGRFTYTHNLRDRWIVAGFGQVESNPDLGFELRGTVGGGAGRNLIQSTRQVLQLIGGLAASREQPVDDDSRTNLEAVSVIRYSAVTYDFPKSETTLTLSVLPSATDPGRVRMNASAKISRAFFTNDFLFAFTAFDDYDNRPPPGAIDSNDLGFSFSVGWKF